MNQEKGIPYRRHKPSAELRAFLDPLDPGSYFDCGQARLHGLDDALLEEAVSRGRQVGDDSFQLVATDMGLIFCRPSISFAIAARWEEVTLTRPHGEEPVVLPVNWPTHGDLKFTVSRRLAGNIFRRWLQIRMQVERVARKERAQRFSTVERKSTNSTDWEVVTEVKSPAERSDAMIGPPNPRQHQQRERSSERAELVQPNADFARPDRRDNEVVAERRRQNNVGMAKRRLERESSKVSTPSEIRPPSLPGENGRSDSSIAAPVSTPADPTAIDLELVDSTPEPPVLPTPGPSTVAPDTPQPAPTAAVDADLVPDERAGDDAPQDRAGDDALQDRAGDDAPQEEVPKIRHEAPPASPPAPTMADDGLTGNASSIRTIDRPPVTQPSWIGSPVSLVGALVVISTFVLITTVAVSSYRRSSEGGGSADPASPTAIESASVGRTTIDHQRFNPEASANNSVEIRSTVTTGLPPSGLPSSGVPPTAGVGAEPSVLEGGPRLCNSNYSGCVPDVSDVDCPNDGDGPLFSTEPAVVMGEDVYGLDTDDDGETCEQDQPRQSDLDREAAENQRPDSDADSDSGGASNGSADVPIAEP